jgi:hypothetical protein
MLGYLDAGTGSMVLAAIAGGAAGAGVAVKAGLDKFRRGGKKKADEPETSDADVEATADDDTAVESTTEA